MLPEHWKFDEELLRIFADEDEGRLGVAVRKLVPIFLLGEAVTDVDTTQKTSGRKERRKIHPFN
jgi:hypothetical protein